MIRKFRWKIPVHERATGRVSIVLYGSYHHVILILTPIHHREKDVWGNLIGGIQVEWGGEQCTDICGRA